MSKHYQHLLGIRVDWQLDRNLISKIKSEKGVRKQEEVRENSSDENQEKGREKKRGRGNGVKRRSKKKRTREREK